MLEDAIKTFLDNLAALREFAALIGSVLERTNTDFLKENARALIPMYVAIGYDEAESEWKLTEEQATKLKDAFGSSFEVESLDDGGCTIHFSNREDAQRVELAMKGFQTQTSHKSLLYGSALISLVSASEWFLSRIIHEYFTRYPDSAGIKHKTLTLEDLKRIGNIEEAKQLLIDQRVDEIMWGGLEDWLSFLGSTMKLSMGYLNPHRASLVEVFQRRNIVIHNNGVVHPSYFAKVPPGLRENVELGDELTVTPEYLTRALDLVELSFILVAAELWKKMDVKDEGRGTILNAAGFSSLQAERWMVGEGFSYFVMNDKQLSERDQLIGCLNY